MFSINTVNVQFVIPLSLCKSINVIFGKVFPGWECATEMLLFKSINEKLSAPLQQQLNFVRPTSQLTTMTKRTNCIQTQLSFGFRKNILVNSTYLPCKNLPQIKNPSYYPYPSSTHQLNIC